MLGVSTDRVPFPPILTFMYSSFRLGIDTGFWCYILQSVVNFDRS